MDWTKILADVLLALSPILVALLSWVSALLAKWIKTKTENEAVEGVLLRLDEAVFDVVMGLEQTVVAELKAKSADGKLTKEDAKAVADRALEYLKSFLGPKGWYVLQYVVFGGDENALKNYLALKVESTVHKVKIHKKKDAS